ncbi:MAG: hypothetical protein ACREPY_10260 [Rhodanobacteraceae bacterium]
MAVLLGVLLALLINQWNNHRQHEAQVQAQMRQQQATVKEALHAIQVELEGNRVALHTSVAELYASARDLEEAARNRKGPSLPCEEYRALPEATGVFVNLTDAAYQTAIATQAIAHMSFRKAHLIAEIYGGQRLFETGTGIIRSRLLQSSAQKTDACIGWLESLGLSEQSLNNAYSMFIGADKTHWPSPPFPFQTRKTMK